MIKSIKVHDEQCRIVCSKSKHMTDSFCNRKFLKMMCGIKTNISHLSGNLVLSRKACLACGLLFGISASYLSTRGMKLISNLCRMFPDAKSNAEDFLNQDFHLNEATFKYTFRDVQKMRKTKNDIFSPTIWVGDLPWKIMLRPTRLSLECHVICSEMYCSWSCCVNLEFSLLGKIARSLAVYHELYEAESQNDYNRSMGCDFPWEDLLDPGNQFIHDDSITFQVSLKVEVLERISWTDKMYLMDDRANTLVRKYKTDLEILQKRIAQMNKRNRTLEKELNLVQMYKNQHFL